VGKSPREKKKFECHCKRQPNRWAKVFLTNGGHADNSKKLRGGGMKPRRGSASPQPSTRKGIKKRRAKESVYGRLLQKKLLWGGEKRAHLLGGNRNTSLRKCPQKRSQKRKKRKVLGRKGAVVGKKTVPKKKNQERERRTAEKGKDAKKKNFPPEKGSAFLKEAESRSGTLPLPG